MVFVVCGLFPSCDLKKSLQSEKAYAFFISIGNSIGLHSIHLERILILPWYGTVWCAVLSDASSYYRVPIKLLHVKTFSFLSMRELHRLECVCVCVCARSFEHVSVRASLMKNWWEKYLSKIYGYFSSTSKANSNNIHIALMDEAKCQKEQKRKKVHRTQQGKTNYIYATAWAQELVIEASENLKLTITPCRLARMQDCINQNQISDNVRAVSDFLFRILLGTIDTSWAHIFIVFDLCFWVFEDFLCVCTSLFLLRLYFCDLFLSICCSAFFCLMLISKKGNSNLFKRYIYSCIAYIECALHKN